MLPNRTHTLTPRQREIVELVARGLTNDDIAIALAISPTTVRTHLTSIMAKLEVTNRTEATSIVLREDARAATMEAMRRPTIAVLPFAVHGDVRARGFGLGLSYELSSLFARWCWFPVISSASTAGARGDRGTRGMVQRLGCRFVVDGAVRVGDALAIEAHIDDAEQGTRVWSGSFESGHEAFCRTQTTIGCEIVASTYPLLIARSYATARDAPSHDLTAWDRAHEGMRLQATREVEANRRARAQLVAARESAPELVLAHYGLGLVAYDAALHAWAPRGEARAELLQSAMTTIALAPHAAEGFFLLGRYHLMVGEIEEAHAALAAAVSRNPSFTAGHALLARAQQLRGRSAAGVASERAAPR